MAAFLNVGASISGPNATVSGSALTENFDRLFGLAAEVLLAAGVSRRRVGSAEDPRPRRPRSSSGRIPRFLPRSSLPGDLQQPPRRPGIRDAGHARRDHARSA